MRNIYLTEQEKQTLLEEFKKSLEEETSENKICVSVMKKETKSQDKITVAYTPEAYAKTVQLIMNYATEVAWHCLVRKENDSYYLVYDVLVYPQKVTCATVETDMNKYADWKINLTDDQDANLFGQCHSHVNMETTPSQTDRDQQKEELQLKGRNGFYLFQIWNKKLDVNTFLYDLENNIMYDKNDIDVIVEFSDVDSDIFVSESKKMLLSKVDTKINAKPETTVLEKSAKKKTSKKKKDEEDLEKLDEFLRGGYQDPFDGYNYLNGYYPDYDRYPYRLNDY